MVKNPPVAHSLFLLSFVKLIDEFFTVLHLHHGVDFSPVVASGGRCLVAELGLLTAVISLAAGRRL